MSEPIQSITIGGIPYSYSEGDLRVLGKAFIKKIKERTDSGKDINGKPFPGYSKSYKKSLDFKTAHKNEEKVNLKLTGDMMGTLEILSVGEGFVTIGYKAGEENDKAAYHRHKSQGTPVVPLRDFLGITDEEKKDVLSQNPPSQTLLPNEFFKREVAREAMEEVPDIIDKVFGIWGL